MHFLLMVIFLLDVEFNIVFAGAHGVYRTQSLGFDMQNECYCGLNQSQCNQLNPTQGSFVAGTQVVFL